MPDRPAIPTLSYSNGDIGYVPYDPRHDDNRSSVCLRMHVVCRLEPPYSATNEKEGLAGPLSLCASLRGLIVACVVFPVHWEVQLAVNRVHCLFLWYVTVHIVIVLVWVWWIKGALQMRADSR